MKRLILGVFIVQMMIIGFFGIPAGGAANASWRDSQTGIVVHQDSPENALNSFYQLVEKGNYQSAVTIFSAADQANMDGSLLQAYFQGNGLEKASLVRTFASPVVGSNAVAISIRMMDIGEKGLQPVVSYHTMNFNEGRWELTQQIDQSDIGQIKLILEHAVEVSNLILKDSLPELSKEQKQFVYQQVEKGRQMMEANLLKVNQLQ